MQHQNNTIITNATTTRRRWEDGKGEPRHQDHLVGTSDHVAVLTKIHFRRPREESYTRILWKWEAANWDALRAALRRKDWEDVLCGNTDQQVGRFTELLHALQVRWVPHATHKTKPSDHPWFGPECRAASDAKYRAWCAYKRHPTTRTRHSHREAAQRMRDTQQWASEHWKANLRGKLRGGQVGTKRWWSLVKEQQGESKGNNIPSLLREDGSVAHTAQDKANFLASHFAGKIHIADLERSPPTLPDIISEKLVGLEILYKAQVRSSLEYACLAWGGAANKHLALLDKVQARAVRIIEDNNAGQEPHLTTLQHRRDVAGLTVVFKVQVKRVSHLQALWQPYRLAAVTNHAVALAPVDVEVFGTAITETSAITEHCREGLLFVLRRPAACLSQG
ncbi:hypothetical protein GWK47_006869 [Chionoecetes opilio]|uniref:Uncharacterized protein n=1 Tax=Chionoecetes opilio TaxID=41210 RepID=A0A8J4YF91_CHIOP|nr:hypothetical protein GWK47_006869 [Chionoecetes opilio]